MPVPISGVHPEVYRRGALASAKVVDLFAGALVGIRAQIDQPDPDAAVRAAYSTVFSALVFRAAYGPAISAGPVDEEVFLDSLSTMVRCYLFTALGRKRQVRSGGSPRRECQR